jgi:hypothetical protein
MPTTVRVLEWNQGDNGVYLGDDYDVATLQERNERAPATRSERHTSRRIKGLAIDYDPDQWTEIETGSKVAHIGLVKVTPTRGTLYLAGRYEGHKLAVLCSHRINDPHGTEGRPFGPMRRLLWQVHAALDRRLARKFIKRGYAVILGTDMNDRTAGLDPLYRLLLGHLDAFGFTSKLLKLVKRLRSIGRRGSDHAGYIATFEFEEHR